MDESKLHHIVTSTSDSGTSIDLHFDDEGNLYVNKKQVIVKTKLSLSQSVNWSIVITAIATVIATFTSIAVALKWTPQ